MSSKIYLDLALAAAQVQLWKSQGLEVVFTNGCFDLLHIGHVQNLADAAALGDKLIVALNSDASINRLKGAHRPIANQISRLAVIAALEVVDMVLIFDTDTPLPLIERLIPDVLAKGGDYTPAQIVGSDIVLNHGGTVVALPFLEGYSTSLLEQKMKK
jgi:rfaE bifunctional protein nucleotidyltransferase chain/domain